MDTIVAFAVFLAAILFCLVKGFSLAWALIVAFLAFFCMGLKRGYRVQTSRNPFHPKTVVQYGVMAPECAALMAEFFRQRR